jgi:hypothetical protein
MLLCLLALAFAAAPASADEADWLYDPTKVVEIDFELAADDETALELEPDEYVPATFTMSAESQTFGPIEVGFRLKGGLGSSRPLTKKAAFKVKFDEYVDDQAVLGLQRLTLNNMVQDPSMVHETLTYDLFRSIGVPASRTGYAFVRINDQPYGVYLNIETLDKISLPTWFESTRHLYEADTPGVDVVPNGQANFEVDRGDEVDLADLEALIAAANDTVGDWSEGMAAVADLGEMTRMWAVERYVGHWDGYAGREDDFRPNNYYLHSLDSGVFRMMPWGSDQTWVVPLAFDEPAGGLLFNNCLADTSCAALYEGALGEVAAVVPGLDLDRRASCTAELLAPWQDLEDPVRRETDAEGIEAGVADTRAFISLRLGELADWLGIEAPESPGLETPCVEEPRANITGPLPAQPDRVLPPPQELPKPALSVRLRGVTVDGRWLKARIVAPVAGKLKLTAKTAGKTGSTVCGARRRVEAGAVSVACKLSGAARGQLEQGPLKLSIRATQQAAGIQVNPALRTVSIPRR